MGSSWDSGITIDLSMVPKIYGTSWDLHGISWDSMGISAGHSINSAGAVEVAKYRSKSGNQAGPCQMHVVHCLDECAIKCRKNVYQHGYQD